MPSKQVSRKFFNSAHPLRENPVARRCHYLFHRFSRTRIGYYCIRMTSLIIGFAVFLGRHIWRMISGSIRAMSSSSKTEVTNDNETEKKTSDDGQTWAENTVTKMKEDVVSSETESVTRHRTNNFSVGLEESPVILSEDVCLTAKKSTAPGCSDELSVAANTKLSSTSEHLESKRVLGKESVASSHVQQFSMFSLWSRTREQVVKDEKGKCYRNK